MGADVGWSVIRILWDLTDYKGTAWHPIAAPPFFPDDVGGTPAIAERWSIASLPPGGSRYNFNIRRHGGAVPWPVVKEVPTLVYRSGSEFVPNPPRPPLSAVPVAPPPGGTHYLLEGTGFGQIDNGAYDAVETAPSIVLVTPVAVTALQLATPTSDILFAIPSPPRTFISPLKEGAATTFDQTLLIKQPTVGLNVDPLGAQVTYTFRMASDPYQSVIGGGTSDYEWTWDGVNWAGNLLNGAGFGTYTIGGVFNGWLYGCTIDDITGTVLTVSKVKEGGEVWGSVLLDLSTGTPDFALCNVAITWPNGIRRLSIWIPPGNEPNFGQPYTQAVLLWRLAGPRIFVGPDDAGGTVTGNSAPMIYVGASGPFPSTWAFHRWCRGVKATEVAAMIATAQGVPTGGWQILATGLTPGIGGGWVDVAAAGPAPGDEIIMSGCLMFNFGAPPNVVSQFDPLPFYLWPEPTALPNPVSLMGAGIWPGGTA